MKKRLLSATLVLLLLANLTACSLLPSGGDSEEDSGDIVASTEDASGNQTEVCDHQWIEATCTEPKTCSICGITEGNPLGHDFAPATVDSPKKCKICGLEEGEIVNVEKVVFPDDGDDAYFDYDNTNDIILKCVFTDEIDGWCLHVYFYDWDSNLLNEDYLTFSDDVGKPHRCYYDDSEGLFYWFTDGNKKSFLEVYKISENAFEKVYSSEVTGSYVEQDDYSININDKYYSISKDGYFCVYDIENNCLCSEDDIVKDELPEYDETLWSCYKLCSAVDGYFVGTKDESSWGYLDKDGNEIAMYADATDFSQSGYALVREDDSTYSIIDKDFNVVGDGLFEGVGASISSGNCFRIWDENGNNILVKIE